MRTVWIGTAAVCLIGAVSIPWFLWKDRRNREAFEIGKRHLAEYRFVADDPEREHDPMNHTGIPRETW